VKREVATRKTDNEKNKRVTKYKEQKSQREENKGIEGKGEKKEKITRSLLTCRFHIFIIHKSNL
jgi:hypothetical protein